jgi:hypothetical protein
MAVYTIDPAHPPLPTAWYLPFQFATGSHTSTLMSESLDGFNVAATRQNDGRFVRAGLGGAAVAPGGVNVPAETVSVRVIVASGKESVAKLSQEAASA